MSLLLLLLISSPCKAKETSEVKDSPTGSQPFITIDPEDRELLKIFSVILSCFGNIVQDPHNTETVAANLVGIAIGIINMIKDSTKGKTNPVLLAQLKGMDAQIKKQIQAV